MNNLNIIDLQQELSDEIPFIPQAAIFVKGEGYDKVLKKIEDNVASINDDLNSYVAKLMGLDKNKYQTFNKWGKDIITKSIPRSQITFLKAYSHKDVLNSYFNMINEYNKNLFNNLIPDENFYVKK